MRSARGCFRRIQRLVSARHNNNDHLASSAPPSPQQRPPQRLYSTKPDDDAYATYSLTDIPARIAAFHGKSLWDMEPAELSPGDELHTRGAEGSHAFIAFMRQFADHVWCTAGNRVLDVGGGMGGFARCMAWNAEAPVYVDVVDYSPVMVEAGAMCSAATALAFARRGRPLPTLLQGDAQALVDQQSQSYDAVTTVHVAMNVANLEAMWSSMSRVTKPGGWLFAYDVIRSPDTPLSRLVYPLPWSHTADLSHVHTLEEYSRVWASTGLTECGVEDVTKGVTEWMIAMAERQRAQQAQQEPPPPSVLQHMDHAKERFANLRNALDSGDLRVIMAAVQKQ